VVTKRGIYRLLKEAMLRICNDFPLTYYGVLWQLLFKRLNFFLRYISIPELHPQGDDGVFLDALDRLGNESKRA